MPTIDINGKELHYLDAGYGKPILFGHSFLFNCTSWFPQIQLLSKHYRCIVPDLWGHGLSDAIKQDNYSIEQIADDYWTLTQALGIDNFSIADKNNPLVDNLASSLAKIDSKSASTIALMGKAIFTRRSLLDQLDQISCPTLIIVGNEDVPRPVKESEEMAALIKNSTLEIIESAGHMSNLEQAEKVNQLLSEFFT